MNHFHYITALQKSYHYFTELKNVLNVKYKEKDFRYHGRNTTIFIFNENCYNFLYINAAARSSKRKLNFSKWHTEF